jgi:choline dehydrogenase-like flavoprotein
MAAFPGVTVPTDSGAGQTGLYWYPMSQDATSSHLRSYARTGHWDGLNRPNYEMLVGAKVNKLLFEGTAAIGVQFVSRNDSLTPAVTVTARKEVILAAGTVHTPQVLMLSGIGPTALLTSAGITTKVDLPGVGSNFQDHSYIPNIGYSWGTTPPNPPLGITQTDGGGGAPSLAAMLGLPVVTPERFEALATAFEAQDPTTYLPSSYTATQIEGFKQQQKVWGRLMRSTGVTFFELMMFRPGGAIQNLHCQSRGTILLNPSNPEGEMIVDYRAASNPVDLEVMIEIIKFMRRFMTTGELAQYKAVESTPGASVASDEQLKTWVKGQIIPSVYHPIGTCAKMPREWGGVVDEELRVHGVERLSVIDASIMPTIVGATTSMTVYAVAEKAADIIKLRTQ